MGRRTWVPLAAVLMAASACSATSATRTTAPPSTSAPSSITASQSEPAPTTASRTSTASSPTPVLSRAQRVLAGMSLAERVGQLLMVDCRSTEIRQDTYDAIGLSKVGSVILDGTSFLDIQATAHITTLLAQRAPPNVGLFVATDQEGGEVQRLVGPGFSSIPSALEQGTFAPATLRSNAQQWGAQLHAAGVNVDLAPVLDTVPAGFGSNPPIGDLNREYGHDPAAVSSHGNAFAQGMQAAGVVATVKHFPGLGRVSGNTDLATGVRDSVTARHDPYLAPFATAIGNGVAFVMMSTAIYTRIDPDRPAAFSSAIVTGMLRGDLGFRGVIVSDDIGIAKQVSEYSVGDRAVDFIAAGGDLVLTVDATQAPEMTTAVLARAKGDPEFRAQVDAAALVVLHAKQARGLLR
jgi:beta-N-acetylhexosaminidase